MSTFIPKSSCQNLVTKCLSHNFYEPGEDKELIIKNLQSRISQLEQKEKEYSLLNQKFKELENEHTLLTEAKLRLEYEINQRNESCNKKLYDLEMKT